MSDRVVVNREDARYTAILARQFNKRFSAHPGHIHIVYDSDQAMAALAEAVERNRRLVVTSGGHCLEGFVSDPDAQVIVDISPMKGVEFDRERQAIGVEAGATVGETLRALHDAWGCLVPLGEHPAIGLGGHVVGGAFGFLCREHGLAADHLYAVEVLTVDRAGTVKRVVASRDASDPNRELWWAHTGGGGGNFGLVTKYWFRSPEAARVDTQALLPAVPESIMTARAEWPWGDIDRDTFTRLLTNVGAWAEQHSAPGASTSSLFTLLIAPRHQLGPIVMRCMSTAGAGAEAQITDYLRAIADGLPPPRIAVERMRWLEFALNPFPDLFAAPPGGVRTKVKDLMLRRRLTLEQTQVVYDYLTNTEWDGTGGMFGLASYGGRVNRVATDATAASQRHAILDAACSAGWLDASGDARHLDWARRFYRDLLADTGGVPVAGEAYDGALINHPDIDLADPAWNTSGVPWFRLYYQHNFERLQAVKARWDPRNVFRHALSIPLP